MLQRQAAGDRDEATQPREAGVVVVVQLGAEPGAAHNDAPDGRSMQLKRPPNMQPARMLSLLVASGLALPPRA